MATERQSTRAKIKQEAPRAPVGSIIDCGALSENDVPWPGVVSARGMIANKKIDRALIDEALRKMNSFYVVVDEAAKTRCIDGRHDPELDESHLGTQVPGGAPGAALAYRLGVDKDDLTRGTFLADAEAMISSFLRHGLAPGGHRDDGQQAGTLGVGCGAIDAMDRILATMTDPALVDDIKRTVKVIMGSQFDRDVFLRVMGAAVVVNGRSEEYFRGREKVLDILAERASNSVATLNGQHQEGLVVVNLVQGTTLASNRFAQSFNGMQAFGYDLWRSLQMAQKILPHPDSEIDRQRFVMARVMTTVATLMALTDGSQRLVLRLPGNPLRALLETY